MISLHALKLPVTALAAATAIGAAGIYYSHGTLEAAKRSLVQREQQLRDARTRLQKSGDEKQLIVRYVDRYRYLQRLGFVGDEQRINWLEGLRLANQQTQLFGVGYQIGTQQPYPYASELDPGTLVLRQSVMRLDFGVLHEGDLMRFLTTLAKQGAGVFSVNQCLMERGATGGTIRFQPNLRVRCEIAWITLKPAEESKKS